MRRAAIALELLTKFSNLCIAGYLPSELQEFFCGGGLIPRNKKKYSGIRPNVVGEFLRGDLFPNWCSRRSTAPCKHCNRHRSALAARGQPFCVKSWLSQMPETKCSSRWISTTHTIPFPKAPAWKGSKSIVPTWPSHPLFHRRPIPGPPQIHPASLV